MNRPSFAIYDASAGSGKTYALVKEYLKIILVATKNDAYRNILAITFTNKAVRELKSRIVENLSEFAKENASIKAQAVLDDLVSETNLTVEQIRVKSQNIIKHIIHNYAAFDILTIDKFTHRVIRTFALDLGLQMNFDVSIDTDNLLLEVVDAVVARAGQDDALTKVLVDFALEKTDSDKSWDVSREILEMAKIIFNENDRQELIHFQDKSTDDFLAVKERLALLCDIIDSDNASMASQALQVLHDKGIDLKSFSRGTFPNHLLSIINKKYNPNNKTFRATEDISINKNAKDFDIIESVLPNLLLILTDIYNNFGRRDFYKAFLKNIVPLSLLQTISTKLKEIQRDKNLLSIAEFNTLIYNEIHNQPAPFIYERLGERYRHFFIDEFQDTSVLQWKNLFPLIDNATSSQYEGEKGTLMIVGDAKQSIYRWRGGKAEQFISLSNGSSPFNNPERLAIKLDKNYRSYSQIINFNNHFFSSLADYFLNDEYKQLYATKCQQNINNKIGGFVSLKFLPEEEQIVDDEEAVEKNSLYLKETLFIIKQQLEKGFALNDIAILVRHNKNGIALANFFLEQNIPFVSSDSLLLKNSDDVRFVIHFLTFLNNQNDLVSKTFLLEYIARCNAQIMPIHDFINTGLTEQSLGLEIWFSTLGYDISFSQLIKKSLYENVEFIISTFISNQTSNAYIQYFLDVVHEREVRGQGGISDFLSYWSKSAGVIKVPSPEGNDAVQIMSIHKSKGLEFPVVIFPFAEENYSRQKRDKLWLDIDDENIDLPKALVYNNKTVETFGEQSRTTYIEKSEEQLLDNINLLYVALTRAEEQLFIISRKLEPNKDGAYPNNLASYFNNYVTNLVAKDQTNLEYNFGDPQKHSTTSHKTSEFTPIPNVQNRFSSRNIKISQKQSSMWGSHRQEAIEYGNIVHEVLSFVKTAGDIDFAIKKTLEIGLFTLDQKHLIQSSLEQIVNHPEISHCYENGPDIMTEQIILQKNGKYVRPDRMVLYLNKNVFLIDYKTGLHHKSYEYQLENYQVAIENIGFTVVKKYLVYIGPVVKVLTY